MATFKETCEEYFGTSDIYEVLGVEHSATDKQIKKAYHKLSLLVHPDRVDESKKDEATEKFKVLGRIHSILQDPDKRRCYDDCGEIDEDSEESFNWMDYWRAIFKPINIKDIDDHKNKYIGSETELRDIKKAYEGSKGNMDVILEMVPFCDCDDEIRIQGIVRKMIDDGEVEEYPGFFNEPRHKKEKRRSKYEQEKKESEMIDIKALEAEIKVNQEKRLRGFASLISDIEAKYGGSGKKRKAITTNSKTPKVSPAKRRSTRSKK